MVVTVLLVAYDYKKKIEQWSTMIICKLRQGVTISKILEDIRSSYYVGEELKRIHP